MVIPLTMIERIVNVSVMIPVVVVVVAVIVVFVDDEIITKNKVVLTDEVSPEIIKRRRVSEFRVEVTSEYKLVIWVVAEYFFKH